LLTLSEHSALLAALTSSLLSRERLYAELDRCRAEPCVCPATNLRLSTITATAVPKAKTQQLRRRLSSSKRRPRETSTTAPPTTAAASASARSRSRERERDVARREKWVVESMRKLAEKSQ
jgi:hypothetical protein